jgi:TAP-like protein/alpha/beta hydrolase fold
LFPHRVRALVLDGSVDPATSSLDATIAQAQGFQGAFGSFAAWCLTAPGCPLGGSAGSSAGGSVADAAGGSVAGAEAKVEALISRANSAPLASRLDDGQVADGAMLLYGVADALYSRSSWPLLRTALASAFTGDGTGLVELAMAGDLASGVLLGWNGDGHTAYGEGSACIDTIVNDYLIDLAVPRSGTVCQH